MKRLAGGLLLLLGALGCDHRLNPPVSQPYAPVREGLTLVYESPDLPPAQRAERRLQVQVLSRREGPSGVLVERAFTTFQGMSTFTFLHQDGGVSLQLPNGMSRVIFPAGFPDRISTWQDGPVLRRVIGFAQVTDLPLPEDHPHTGVWVESSSQSGVRSRSLFLPLVGEVETRLWADGQWVVVNRLVARSFHDIPRPAQPAARP